MNTAEQVLSRLSIKTNVKQKFLCHVCNKEITDHEKEINGHMGLDLCNSCQDTYITQRLKEIKETK